MRNFPVFRFLTLALVLSSCASPSKKECEQMNWQEVGFQVGLKGQSPRQEFEHYTKACTEEHGIAISKQKFDFGYSKGVDSFCSSQDYAQWGRQGQAFAYPELCDPKDKIKAQEDHRMGLLAYCTYDVGYSRGLSGQHYQNVCSDKNEAQFLKGYNLGVQKRTMSKIDDLSNQVQNLQNELENRDYQIRKLNKKIRNLEDELEEKDRKLRSSR